MTISEHTHSVRAIGKLPFMIRGPIRLIVACMALNAVILVALIPALSAYLKPFYSQDIYADGYNLLASNLVAGYGYRFYPDTADTLIREPGYPVLLAGIVKVFGESIVAVQVVNWCFVAAAAMLVVKLARKITTNGIAPLLAPLLFIFHPGTLVAESRAGVEAVLTFLVTLSIFLIYRATESNKTSDHAIAGIVLGLTVLVRSTPMLFPVFLLAYCIACGPGSVLLRKIISNIAVLTVAMFLTMSPWIVRNFRVTGRFMPTASVLGVSMQAGQYICEHSGDRKPWFILDREASQERAQVASQLGLRMKEGEIYYQVFYSTQDELSFSQYLAHRTVEKYWASPLLCLKCIGSNLVNFWIAGKDWHSRSLNAIVQAPFLACAAWGFVLSFRSGNRFAWLALLFIGYSIAVCLPILAQARYSVPLLPLLSVFAAIALETIWHRTVRGLL